MKIFLSLKKRKFTDLLPLPSFSHSVTLVIHSLPYTLDGRNIMSVKKGIPKLINFQACLIPPSRFK